MDYTSLALVKQEIISGGSPSISSQFDSLITRLVSAASADIEEYCTQTRQPACADYFKLETKTDEILAGLAYVPGGYFIFWPHKPFIQTVSKIETRADPTQNWATADITSIWIDGNSIVVYDDAPDERFQVRTTYSGGFGADLGTLPASLIEAATVLAARYFKEASTGLSDAIGVTDIGVLTYTKAMPQRVKLSLDRLRRVVPW